MARNVQFYGSMNKALGGDPIQRDYAQDPRRLMAQQLMQQGSSTAPVQSPLEGLTRALSGVAGGYFGGQAQRDMQEREQARNEDINQVIAGGNAKQWVNPDTGNTTIQQDGIAAGPGDVPTMVQTDKNVGGYAGMQAALANIDNPDIANFRQNVAMGEMQERRALEAAELARAKKIAALKEQRIYDESVAEKKRLAAIELKGSPEPESNMPFSGTGMEAQDRNILLRGNPNSAAYASAYANQSNPRISVGLDGRQTIVTPNMSWARKPTYNSNNIPTNTLNGNPLNRPTTEDATQSALGPNAPTITTSQPKRLLPAVKAKIDKAVNGAATLVNSLLNYQKTFKAADFAERGKSAFGLSTPSNNAWTSAALMAKGEELYNLGVLSGPDLEIIQKAFPDPSTRKGALASDADIDSSVNTVIDLIQDKITGMQRINNVPIINIRNFAKELEGLVPDQTQGVDEEIPQESIDAEIERRKKLQQNKGT